jgi:hypothetical protein
MKRNLVLSGVLLFAALNALGQSRQQARFANPLLDDVVQMSRAQLPEATILAFVRARQSRLETDVTAGDLVRLHRAGVSDRVVEFIASISGLEDRPAARDREPGVAYDSSGSSDVAPADPGDGDVAIDPEPYGPVDGGWGWGWGWGGYPYWYDYSPFFYGGGVVVIRGGGRFHHRGFDHRGGGHHDRRGTHSHGGGSHGGGGRHGGGSHGGGGHHGGHR